MRKSLLIAFLTAIMIGGLAFIDSVHLGTVQASTNVTGIITSDTTWTKANSPYVFAGPVGVNSGVTLTIEPGVTVNLGAYYLQVSGTLYARGTSENKIYFVSDTALYGNIAFADGSSSWNEQTGSGCIIENALLSSTSISMKNVSPKINNNTVSSQYYAINIDGNSPLISNNIITGNIGVHSSSPKIDNNSIIGGIDVGGDSPIISNNTINRGGDEGDGIKFEGPYNVYISDNVIYGCRTGVRAECRATIERNLIINNDEGMEVLFTGIQIRHNTIADNSIAIKIRYSSSPTTVYNNIQNNIQNSIYLSDAGDFNATYNWWGTTDAQIIDLTIHDSKSGLNVGKVTFVPFLTTPNLEAPATSFTPIPTSTPSPTQSPPLTQSPSPSKNPTASPGQSNTQSTSQTGLNDIVIAAIVISVIINVSLVIVVALLLKKKR